jgi:hypothetical protein
MKFLVREKKVVGEGENYAHKQQDRSHYDTRDEVSVVLSSPLTPSPLPAIFTTPPPSHGKKGDDCMHVYLFILFL